MKQFDADELKFLQIDPKLIERIEPGNKGKIVLLKQGNPGVTERFLSVSCKVFDHRFPLVSFLDSPEHARQVFQITGSSLILTTNWTTFELWVHGGFEAPEKIASSSNLWTITNFAKYLSTLARDLADPGEDERKELVYAINSFRRNQSKFMKNLRENEQ
jgi:hypothetical protein